ncbi:MAG: hypothetical protein FWD69_18695 [Polyangiaceae bacterium]|nr:hypothetical protein [Polyangiaceae bacterium]
MTVEKFPYLTEQSASRCFVTDGAEGAETHHTCFPLSRARQARRCFLVPSALSARLRRDLRRAFLARTGKAMTGHQTYGRGIQRMPNCGVPPKAGEVGRLRNSSYDGVKEGQDEGQKLKSYHTVKFQIKETTYYCIWHTNGIDGLIVEANHIKYFHAISDLKTYCLQNHITLSGEAAEYNVDRVTEWLLGDKKLVDCKFMLDILNIMSDVAHSAGEYFYGDCDDLDDIYYNLFYGNNLPSVTPSGELYVPTWSCEEIAKMSNVLEGGLGLLKRNLGIQQA